MTPKECESKAWRPDSMSPWRYFLSLMRQICEKQGVDAWSWVLEQCIHTARAIAREEVVDSEPCSNCHGPKAAGEEVIVRVLGHTVCCAMCNREIE